MASQGSDTFTSPNAVASSGSISSESLAYAALKACNLLNCRLKEYRQTLHQPWETAVESAHRDGECQLRRERTVATV